MFGKLTIGALLALGLFFIAIGVQRWLDHRAALSVVDAYMLALKNGDRQAALQLLNPEQRALAEAAALRPDAVRWAPNPGVKYRVHHIRITGTQAAARLWIEKEGFVVQPTLSLDRGETNRWKIGRVEDLRIDPLWHDLQRERARLEGEQLANELAKALAGRPGVDVTRVPLTELPR